MSSLGGLQTLSNRASENVTGVDYWGPMVAALANPWTPSNPKGLAIMGIAENTLMHNELEEHLKNNFTIDRSKHFTYGNGPQGSPRLLNALSNFFNERFNPLVGTQAHEFVLTAGVTSLIDHLTWCICNEGDAILFPRPMYAGFTNDVLTRAKGKLIPVSFLNEDGSLDFDNVFDEQSNTRCLERAYQQCQAQGIRVKGIMITNPHNPLGKCYPVRTIQAIARFCSTHKIHYLSDEIYAMSTFENPAYPNATKFTSVLGVELADIIDPQLVHVLYGMSKDFCANGLRLGTLYTRNAALRAAVTGIAAFGWETYLAQDMWARILEDRPFLDKFIAENRKRLAQRYVEVTEFLRSQGIQYFEGGNAGVFIWVDLRSWMRESCDEENKTAMILSSSTSHKYEAMEQKFGEMFWNKGVVVSKGTGYLAEELGWFRIIFTIEEATLQVGLERFIEGLHEATKESRIRQVKGHGVSYRLGTPEAQSSRIEEATLNEIAGMGLNSSSI